MCYDNKKANIESKQINTRCLYIFKKILFKISITSALRKKQLRVKGVKQPFYVKRFNYNYQEIKNLRGCQEKSYWALKGRECCQ